MAKSMDKFQDNLELPWTMSNDPGKISEVMSVVILRNNPDYIVESIGKYLGKIT